EIQKWFKPRLDLSIEDQDNDIPLVTKQYLTLRRAILNVIDELQKNDDKIELNEDFKKGDFDKTAFLENIKWLLQAHEQPTLSEEFFLTLCDTFTKPFDIFSLWSNKNDIPPLISRNPLERSCLIPPFFLRNWIAHGLIPGSITKFGARDAGFVFLMVMKSMFNREMYGKEDELKQLFENVSSNKKYLMDQAFKLQQTEYKFSLEGQILKQIENKGTKDKNRKWMRENYLKHIYASNLFSSFKQVPESRMKDIRDIELDNKNNMRYIVTSAYELLDTPFLDITSLMLKENIK
ncbi:hypothetical protein OAK62_06210, partial [Deltaproteobacteria bacterium]|nr:hypothetical protein [Deltaproteobacteria bacterium]